MRAFSRRPAAGALALGVLGALAAGLGACRLLLGLDELPLVTTDAGAADVVVVDAADACVVGTSYCASLCPRPAFCDDFQEGTLGARATMWAAPTDIPQPLQVGDVAFALAEDDAGGTRELVAHASAVRATAAAVGLLSHQLLPRQGSTGGASGRGFRFKAQLRVERAAFDLDGGAPDRYFSFTGLSGLSAFPVGMSLVFHEVPSSEKFRLALEQRAIGPGAAVLPLISLAEVDREVFIKNRIEFDFVVGTSELFLAKGLACDAPGDGVRVLLRFLAQSYCAPLADTLANPVWLKDPIIGVGVIASGDTDVVLHLDNVVAELF